MRPAGLRAGPRHPFIRIEISTVLTKFISATRRRRRPVLSILVLLTLISTSGFVVSAARPEHGALRLSVPSVVAVGEPITIEMVVARARDLAGFEAIVSYDPGAAHFGGLDIRTSGLRRAGPGLQALGPSDLTSGVAFGQYSCPSIDCVSRATRGVRGASGTVRLARVTIIPDQPGRLELQVDGMRFVGPDGAFLNVVAPPTLVSVQVGGSDMRHAAPDVRREWPLSRPAIRTDLTGDGMTTHADAMEVGLAWELGRMSGDPCSTVTSPADVTGDGCVDVADAQTVASRFSVPNAKPAVGSPSGLGEQTFTVTTTGDTDDSAAGDGVCLASGGGCTLRAAITEANLHPGPDTIAFAISGSGVQTINLSSSLPTINDGTGGTTIDGYTQPDAAVNTLDLASNAAIRIEISSSSESVGWHAMAISSSNNVIRGLSMHHNWRSISFLGPNAAYNAIVGNFIGTNAAGTYRTTSWNHANGGIYLNGGAHHNEFGRPALADRNVISGNAASGIYHVGDDTAFNLTRNNIIGLTPLGTGRLNNRLEGVDFNGGASDNTVGGMALRERNVISGNSANGVEMSHGTNVRRNRIIGNVIGTDVSGSFAASYTVNSNWGIGIEDGATETYVANNVIGNGNQGGIAINGYTQGTTTGTIVRDNLIGISLTGTPIPNGGYGIRVSLDANNTQIGPGNVITNNPYGVILADARNYATVVTRNSIYNNTNLGIDLRPQTGVTPNDFGDTDAGANSYLNFPALTSATPSSVNGSACAGCSVEVFVADGGATDYGEGRVFLGNALAGSDGRFSIPVSGVSVGQYVTATATDGVGNTSEFSLNMVVTSSAEPAGTIVASDSYGRTAADRWGAAESGGFWALSGAAADFDVANGMGTVRIGVAGQTRAASLLSVSVRDVDIRARIQTDKAAVGGNQNAWLVARQVALGTEYRVRIRQADSGLIYLNAARVVGNAETYLSGDVVVQGVAHVPGSFLMVRAEVAGVAPVSIRVKVWANGSQEPAAWNYAVTDGSNLLLRPGAVGVRAYVQGGTTNTPITYGFDDFTVTTVSPSAPIADFTWTQVTDTLEVQFTDTSMNEIDSWTWDFGDGNSSTAQNASHTYATSGSYIVTLTVSGPGGIDSEAKTIVVTDPVPPPTIYAQDVFERTVSGGWGSADIGGPYTGTGSAANFTVTGGTGQMTLPAAGATRAQYLAGLAQRDVDIRFRVAADKLAQGGNGQFVYAVARRIGAGNEYSAKLRIASDGRLYVNVSRFSNGAETVLGSVIQVPNVTLTPGAALWLRMTVIGADPTTIRIKAWADGTAEPSTWLITLTDSFASLQVQGGVGLRGYLGGQATNAPVLLSFDDYAVTSGP